MAIPSYADERLFQFCVYCGAAPTTRDHCPSKVLLDDPYPVDLAIVPACRTCNEDLSIDEEYVACLISVVLAGSTNPAAQGRSKIADILARSPGLQLRLARAGRELNGQLHWQVEQERVARVFKKLARAHALHEMAVSESDEPAHFWVGPLADLDSDRLSYFEDPPPSTLYPEVGSRALQRWFEEGEGWVVVQPNRYRFHCRVDGGVEIRIVASEYLACYCRWD